MLGSASFSRDCGNPEANAAGGTVLEVTISPSGAFMYGVAVATTTTRGVFVAGRSSQRVNHFIVTVWTKPALTPLPDVSLGMPVSVNLQTVQPRKLAAVRREVAPGAIGSACGPALGKI